MRRPGDQAGRRDARVAARRSMAVEAGRPDWPQLERWENEGGALGIDRDELAVSDPPMGAMPPRGSARGVERR